MTEHITQEVTPAIADIEAIRPTTTSLQKDRITCRLMFHHQSRHTEPFSVESVFWKEVKSDQEEGPFRRIRKLKKNEEFETPGVPVLELCHVENPGYIIIKNTTQIDKGVTPTQEELKVFQESCVMVMSRRNAVATISPGECFMAKLLRPNECELVCVGVDSRVEISVFPE